MQGLDIAATRQDPPIQILPILLDARTSDPSKFTDCTLEPQQRLRNTTAVGIRLIDLRVWLPRPPALGSDERRPAVPIEEPRGPRELVLVHLR